MPLNPLQQAAMLREQRRAAAAIEPAKTKDAQVVEVPSQEVKAIESQSPEKPFVFPDAIVQDEVIEVVDSSVEIKKNGKHQVDEVNEINDVHEKAE